MSCFLLLPCRLPVATLSPPYRFPVALLSHLRCRLPVASLPLSCRFPVVFLSPPCRLPVATLSPSCRSLPHFAVAYPNLLLELALEKESDKHLKAYRPGGGGSGSHGQGYQGPRPGQGTTSKHARIMDNVKELFWCDPRDQHGHLQHAPDCEQRDCFVVQGKKQETNTGAKAKMPDHYRCTLTCALCGNRKHYEDECYHKQRLSAKLKGEDPGKGSGKGGGKGNRNDSGKGKSKGRGKGQDKRQDGRGGGANRHPDKDNKNPDKNGGNPKPNPGGNSEPSGGQSGPTTRSQTQVQREQGAKREHEGGDDGNAKKRSRFMRMARKLRDKGFEVTCPAEFRRGRSVGALDLVFWVRIRLGGREYLEVLDTGATISIVAKTILPCGSLKNTMTTAAIRMGDGHVVHSCGDCEVEVSMGSRNIAHRFYVMDTEAFDFVLATDFFVQHSQIQSLRCKRPTSSTWTTEMAESPCHWSSRSTPRRT